MKLKKQLGEPRQLSRIATPNFMEKPPRIGDMIRDKLCPEQVPKNSPHNATNVGTSSYVSCSLTPALTRCWRQAGSERHWPRDDKRYRYVEALLLSLGSNANRYRRPSPAQQTARHRYRPCTRRPRSSPRTPEEGRHPCFSPRTSTSTKHLWDGSRGHSTARGATCRQMQPRTGRHCCTYHD